MKSKKRRPNPNPQSFSPPKNKKLRSHLPRRKRPRISPFSALIWFPIPLPPPPLLLLPQNPPPLPSTHPDLTFLATSALPISGRDDLIPRRRLDTTSKLKNRSSFRTTINGNEDQIDPAENGVEKFEFTDVDVSSKLCGKEAVVLTSCVESCAESIFQSVCPFEEKRLEVEDNRLWEFQLPELPRNEINETFTVSKSDSTIEQWPGSLKFESDLACTEQFSYDDVSEYSSQALSLQSTILLETSDEYCSDYTPSIFLESGSEFSEKSNEDAAPSSTFRMLLQYRRDFLSLNSSPDIRTSSPIEEEKVDQSTILRFEELDDEEAYRMFRNRERRQLIIHDYIEEYRSTTDYGDLILQQRSNMVQWIVEVSPGFQTSVFLLTIPELA
ncbi:hypothetical protein IC575_030858 [Cucumis melo]